MSEEAHQKEISRRSLPRLARHKAIVKQALKLFRSPNDDPLAILPNEILLLIFEWWHEMLTPECRRLEPHFQQILNFAKVCPRWADALSTYTLSAASDRSIVRPYTLRSIYTYRFLPQLKRLEIQKREFEIRELEDGSCCRRELAGLQIVFRRYSVPVIGCFWRTTVHRKPANSRRQQLMYLLSTKVYRRT